MTGEAGTTMDRGGNMQRFTLKDDQKYKSMHARESWSDGGQGGNMQCCTLKDVQKYKSMDDRESWFDDGQGGKYAMLYNGSMYKSMTVCR